MVDYHVGSCERLISFREPWPAHAAWMSQGRKSVAKIVQCGGPLWNRTGSGSVLDEPSSKTVPNTQPLHSAFGLIRGRDADSVTSRLAFGSPGMGTNPCVPMAVTFATFTSLFQLPNRRFLLPSGWPPYRSFRSLDRTPRTQRRSRVPLTWSSAACEPFLQSFFGTARA